MQRLAMARLRPSLQSLLHLSSGSALASRKWLILQKLNPSSIILECFIKRSVATVRSESEEADADPTEQRSPPSDKIHRLADEIASLTLLEVTDLSSLIKKKLGLPNIPMGMPFMPGMVMPGSMPSVEGPPQAAEKEPEKTAFDVKLEKYDTSAKIKIIKEVRTFTALGLKEAKELVEKTPAVLKKGVSKEEALQIVEKIKAAGGTAVME